MERYGIIKSFLHTVEKLKYDEIMHFFSTSASVYSPVFGKKVVSAYFKEVIRELDHMKVEVKHIYQCLDKTNELAAYVTLTFHFIEGSVFHTEGVYLFEFGQNNEKIEELKLLYDASEIHSIVEKLKT